MISAAFLILKGFFTEAWHIARNITLRGWLWIGGLIALMVLMVVLFKSCGSSHEIDQKKLDEINYGTKVREERDTEIKQNASREREAELTRSNDEAAANTNAAKNANYDDVSNDELKRRLEKRARK